MLAMPEHVERSGLSLALGDHPMLDADALTAMRVGPACNVSGRPNCWHARFEIGIHDNTAINDKPRHFCKFGPRAHTDTDDHEIRFKCLPPLSVTRLLSMARAVSSRLKTTPCSSCSERTKSPICAPRMRSIGLFSGATTWTSIPRARREPRPQGR